MAKKIKKLKSSLIFGLCPICRSELKEKNAYIIEKSGATAQYCVKCVSCSSNLLFSISLLNINTTATIGILTDVQKNDLELIKSKIEVSVDDVLEIHKYLENCHIGGKNLKSDSSQ